MNAIVRTSMLVAVAALASACTSTGNPWWTYSNNQYYTTPSGTFSSPSYPGMTPAAPVPGAPDKVEGSQSPAVPGPTS